MESPDALPPGCVVWRAVRSPASGRRGGRRTPSGITVDKEKKTVTIDCKIAPRKIDDPSFKEIYPDRGHRLLAVPKDPGKGGPEGPRNRGHLRQIKPSEVHKALEEPGPQGRHAGHGRHQKDVPQGPEVNLFLEIPGAGRPAQEGADRRRPWSTRRPRRRAETRSGASPARS